MQITATQTFRHGYETYEEGETYDVLAELAGYFVGVGWATSPDIESPGEPQPAETTLDVDDATHDQATEV
jgi:hypothetical protein